MKKEDLLDEEFARGGKKYSTKWPNVLGIGMIYGVYSLFKFYFLAVFLELVMDVFANKIGQDLVPAIILFALFYILFLICIIIVTGLELMKILDWLKKSEYLEEVRDHMTISTFAFQLVAFFFAWLRIYSFPLINNAIFGLLIMITLGITIYRLNKKYS